MSIVCAVRRHDDSGQLTDKHEPLKDNGETITVGGTVSIGNKNHQVFLCKYCGCTYVDFERRTIKRY